MEFYSLSDAISLNHWSNSAENSTRSVFLDLIHIWDFCGNFIRI